MGGILSAGLLSATEPRSFFERVLLPGDPGQPVDAMTSIIYSVAIVAVAFLPFISVVAMFSIWAERKVAGHMQSRIGPNRVGPIGILQSIADGVKLILKEDLIPKDADRFLFRLAPYLAFAPVFAAFVALPFGPEMTFEPRLNVGVFYVLAVLSVEVMGVILAGWASNNKWSVYGAMREACQMVSYEIPLGISIIVAVMAAGTLNMVQMSHMQGGGIHTWIIFKNPFVFLAFFMYFIASLASNKRAPFDLPESESELVAGFHTEYSGLRFSFFFFAEYAAMFVVGGIQTALFLGSWHDPFGLIGYYHHELTKDPNNVNTGALVLLNLIAATIFVAKAGIIIFVQMWLRWTLPRPRIDQVLYACVKVLLPLACVILLGATLWQLFVPERPGIPWVGYDPFSWKDLSATVVSADGKVLAGSTGFSSIVQILLAIIGIAGFLSICGWIGYAIISGRNLKQRLTDPAPIDQAPESLVKA
ncbi:MAG TPA: NADH-quinone oxidoreductase subunit NuoH [Tepidisphaeraceae bacterium]|nr:NADH-quinone oxidoreductase subunit NuoH [Tepidisphaeraceae bacterium]